MAQILLLTVGALVVGAIGFGVAVLISGSDPGLAPVEPDGTAIALPSSRPLVESDLGATRFDTALRGYRMTQVDTALRRAAYDIGYKQELIGVLEAEVDALRSGRVDDAEKLRAAREAALSAIADRTGVADDGAVEVSLDETPAEPPVTGETAAVGSAAVPATERAPAPATERAAVPATERAAAPATEQTAAQPAGTGPAAAAARPAGASATARAVVPVPPPGPADDGGQPRSEPAAEVAGPQPPAPGAALAEPGAGAPGPAPAGADGDAPAAKQGTGQQ